MLEKSSVTVTSFSMLFNLIISENISSEKLSKTLIFTKLSSFILALILYKGFNKFIFQVFSFTLNTLFSFNLISIKSLLIVLKLKSNFQEIVSTVVVQELVLSLFIEPHLNL